MWKVRIAHIANKRICCVTKPLLNTIIRVLWCIYYLLDLSNLKIFTLDEDAVILADDHKFCFCCLFWLVFITPWPLGGSITSLPAFLDWGARRHHWLPCEMRNERRISSWRRVNYPTSSWVLLTFGWSKLPTRHDQSEDYPDPWVVTPQLISCNPALISQTSFRGEPVVISQNVDCLFFLGYSNLSLKTTPHGSSRKGKQPASCPNVVCLLDKFGGRENQRTIHPNIKLKIIYYITASLTNTALLESKHPGILKLLNPDPLSHFLTLLSRAEIYWNMCAMFTSKASESF